MIAGNHPLVGLGGHSRYVRIHARAAIRAGFEPHLFCVGRESSVQQTEIGVVHQIASPYRPLRIPMIPAHAPRLAAAVEQFLMVNSASPVIHGFGLWGYVSVGASERLTRRGIRTIPVVSGYHTLMHQTQGKLRGGEKAHGPLRRAAERAESIWNRFVLERYEQKAYEGAAQVLFNYESVRRLLVARYNIAATLRKVPYTTERAFEDQQAALPVPDVIGKLRPVSGPLLVAVSRHDPRKGLNVLLRALAKLRDQGIPFRACLVGAGPLIDAHRRLVEHLQLSESVLITGFVPDPQAYLQPADAFVLPSLEEGSGSLSLLEALQAGVAVVASNIDGIPEDVTNEDSALLVEPNDVDALSEALSRVLNDRDLRVRLARRARETFAEKFTSEQLVAVLRELYSTALV